MLGPSWGMILYPEHITYYSPRTLDRVVELSGLKRVNTYTENISLFRIVQFVNRFRGTGKIDAESVSGQAQHFVTENNVARLAKTGINRVLGLTGLGSSIVAVYEK